MKKGKKFIIGIILIVIGAVGLFGLFGNTDDKAALAGGSVLLIAGGVVLVYLDKKNPAPATEAPVNVAPSPAQNIDTYTFKAAGVTFSNNRKTRQAILRKIYWHDEPFVFVSYSLRKYDFEGSPAIGIYANGEQIGNVPKDDVSDVLPLLDRITKISVNVSGGGQTESGENINFGANVTITYTK